MTKLEQAARQALKSLEKIAYDTANPDTEKAITALREALAEQEKPLYRKVLREMLDAHEQAKQKPVAWMYDWEFDGKQVKDWVTSDINMTGFNNGHNVRPLYAAPVQQAEQEPVAIVDEIGLCLDGRPIFNAVGKVKVGQKLYAAPVRTKDLTDDEINALIDKSWIELMTIKEFARAVIAADREKNK